VSEIEGLYAIRIVTNDGEKFAATVAFYEALLGEAPFRQFGDPQSVHQAAFFQVREVQIVVTREEEPTPESGIHQGPVWLCFRTANPDAAFSDACERGADLRTPPVPTSFGTRAFFANDPCGLATYVGTGWD
jgi:uncharacterized glyoxalase superfamily protein PhnB